jgi:hypothetical protein
MRKMEEQYMKILIDEDYNRNELKLKKILKGWYGGEKG